MSKKGDRVFNEDDFMNVRAGLLQHKTYAQIGLLLGRTAKSVEHYVQRNKLKHNLDKPYDFFVKRRVESRTITVRSDPVLETGEEQVLRVSEELRKLVEEEEEEKKKNLVVVPLVDKIKERGIADDECLVVLPSLNKKRSEASEEDLKFGERGKLKIITDCVGLPVEELASRAGLVPNVDEDLVDDEGCVVENDAQDSSVKDVIVELGLQSAVDDVSEEKKEE